MRLDLGMVAGTWLKGDFFNKIIYNKYLGQLGDIFLGRIPTTPGSLGGTNVDVIRHNLQVKLVISSVLPHEYIKTCLVTTIQPDEWREQYGIDFYWLPALDKSASFDINHFIQALVLIHCYLCDGKKVYVHCKSGMGRSATVVAAYLIVIALANGNIAANEYLFIENVIQHMRKCRSIVNPMPPQRKFLLNNFNNWKLLAQRLRDGCVTPSDYQNLYTPTPQLELPTTSPVVSQYSPSPYGGHR